MPKRHEDPALPEPVELASRLKGFGFAAVPGGWRFGGSNYDCWCEIAVSKEPPPCYIIVWIRKPGDDRFPISHHRLLELTRSVLTGAGLVAQLRRKAEVAAPAPQPEPEPPAPTDLPEALAKAGLEQHAKLAAWWEVPMQLAMLLVHLRTDGTAQVFHRLDSADPLSEQVLPQADLLRLALGCRTPGQLAEAVAAWREQPKKGRGQR
jgi:hypothetical protein